MLAAPPAPYPTMHDASMPDAPLTTRSDRVEAAITRAIGNPGTDGELRSSVDQLIDEFCLEGIPLEIGITRVRHIAVRASVALVRADLVAGEAAAEHVALVVRWAIERYRRHD